MNKGAPQALEKAKTGPKPVKMMACDALGVDSFCERVIGGESQSSIAHSIGVSPGTMVAWIGANTERSARVKEARIHAASAYSDKAEQGLNDAADPFELSKAKELAHHWRWKASKCNPREWGDKIAIGGADDLPAIQSQTTMTDEQLAFIATTSSNRASKA